MLTARRGAILRVIIGDYIEKATPVGSQHIAKIHPLGVSPATIRNDMAALEDEGYITHPHTSAGRIPSDKGYRYFIEVLMEEDGLSPMARRDVRRRIAQHEGALEEWAKLPMAVLAQLAQAMALITVPKAPAAHYQHLELVPLQDLVMLIVLVLQQARVKQQLLHLEAAIPQEELSILVQRLNATFTGLNVQQIAQHPAMPLPLEDQITRAVVRLMESEDAQNAHTVELGGLRNLLDQPEFSSNERLAGLMELVEDRGAIGSLLPRWTPDDGVRVVIGSENPRESMREFSIVLAPYGIPGQLVGTLGVVGPTRMRYARTIATVRYLSELMSELLVEQHG